jgi:tryptophan-rich sensory protein
VVVGAGRAVRRIAAPNPVRRRIEGLAIAALPLVVGGLSGLVTAPAIAGWYRSLEKPAWNPPDAVFGPVWTLLYLSMGIALLQVWRLDRRRGEVRLALVLFALQLALNAAWSLLFFGARRPDLALAEMIALHLAIVATLASFARLRPGAAALLVPYLAWVSFALALNVEIVRLNG